MEKHQKRRDIRYLSWRDLQGLPTRRRDVWLFKRSAGYCIGWDEGSGGDPDSEITKGMWQCVEGGKVVTTLEEASSAEGGHQGSKVYAIEAMWLWQKGGGKVMKAF